MTTAVAGSREQRDAAFEVHVDGFDGPFDLLLSLIARRRLDVTLLALSQVTDDFVAYIRDRDGDWDLDQASEFLVVAATLLDLKVARLLPGAVVEDDEDLALLEARDLLFARLLQYRAYKQVATVLGAWYAATGRTWGRSVALERPTVVAAPAQIIRIDPQRLARLAAALAVPRQPPTVDVGHVHAPVVSVREQAAVLAARLRATTSATFRALTDDCDGLAEVVGRFLALLELYREAAVAFSQVEPLGELHVRWTGGAGDGQLSRSSWADGDEGAPPPSGSSAAGASA